MWVWEDFHSWNQVLAQFVLIRHTLRVVERLSLNHCSTPLAVGISLSVVVLVQIYSNMNYINRENLFVLASGPLSPTLLHLGLHHLVVIGFESLAQTLIALSNDLLTDELWSHLMDPCLTSGSDGRSALSMPDRPNRYAIQSVIMFAFIWFKIQLLF